MVADPGGIYISKSVQGAISSRKEINAKFVGEILLKNVADPEMHYLVVAPIYDILREEPRFQELVKKVNVPQNPDSGL